MKIPQIPEAVNTDALVASAVSHASLFSSEFIPTESENVSSSGGSFTIPLLLPIGRPTGDGRQFEQNSLTSRELPLPLLWQFKTDSGHNQSVVVGRIDSIDITEQGIQNVKGVFDVNPYARECERMVRNGFLRGVSADLDSFVASEEEDPKDSLSNKGKKTIKNSTLNISEARLMGATVVPLPAFQEASIKLDTNTSDEEIQDGEYEDGVLKETELETIVASAAPLNPPRAWFNTRADKPTPLTITDDGQVFGHLALWSSGHIGMSNNVRPPRSASNYQFFRTGVVRADDGTDVTVGSITLVGGHAPLQASAEKAAAHYDNTQSAFCDVVASEDRFGIWLSGSLRPNVTPEQIRSARASAISGDWRNINGRLELVRICSVNTPGFMSTRTMVASGAVNALVAAGTSQMQELSQQNAEIDELKARLFQLESKPLVEEAFAVFKADIEKQLTDKAAEAARVFGL